VRLYYLTPAKALTTASIIQSLFESPEFLQIQISRAAPPSSSSLSTSLLLLDLDRVDSSTPVPALNQLPIDSFAIVYKNLSIPSEWLPLLRRQELNILSIASPHPLVHPQVASILRARIRNLAMGLTNAVLERSTSLLGDCREMIQEILRNPWGIRTPKDLASALRISVADLRLRCSRMRISRSEHILTAIRCLALDYLIGEHQFTVRDAMRAVGIRDRSNFRRQWRRARYAFERDGRPTAASTG
jgi:hypothetical protein